MRARVTSSGWAAPAAPVAAAQVLVAWARAGHRAEARALAPSLGALRHPAAARVLDGLGLDAAIAPPPAPDGLREAPIAPPPATDGLREAPIAPPPAPDGLREAPSSLAAAPEHSAAEAEVDLTDDRADDIADDFADDLEAALRTRLN